MSKKNYKYTIHGFQQKKLIEQGLDNNDALVMAVVRDMYSSASIEHKIIDGDRYIWVSQTALSEYVPIVGTLRTLQRIFKKLLNKGVFESRVLNGRNGKTGKYFYVKPNKLLEDLTEYVVIDQELDQATKCRMNKRQSFVRSSNKMSLDQATKCRNKDTPNNDTPNNDNTLVASKDSRREQVDEIVEMWNQIEGLPQVRRITEASKRYKYASARLKEEGFDTVAEVIQKVASSDFLRGKNRNNWTANFEWAMTASNFIKILEDTYINKESNHEASRGNNSADKLERIYEEGRRAIEEFDFENFDGTF